MVMIAKAEGGKDRRIDNKPYLFRRGNIKIPIAVL